MFEDEKIEKNSRFGALGGDDTFKEEEHLDDDMESELTEQDDKKKMLSKNKIDNTAIFDK